MNILWCLACAQYITGGADKSLARPGRKQLMFLSEWREYPLAPCMCSVYYRGADNSLARPGRKQLMFLSELREYPLAPCLAGGKNLITIRVSILLKSLETLKYSDTSANEDNSFGNHIR